MRFGKTAAALAAAIVIGSTTAASAQVPNLLNWLFPNQKNQPANSAAPTSGHDCSTDPRPSAYFNDCGEYIPGMNDSPIHG
jgi:hypothetical protein